MKKRFELIQDLPNHKCARCNQLLTFPSFIGFSTISSLTLYKGIRSLAYLQGEANIEEGDVVLEPLMVDAVITIVSIRIEQTRIGIDKPVGCQQSGKEK